MLKRTTSIIVSLILAMSLAAGCGKAGTSTKDGGTAKKIKIGLTTSEGGINDKSFNQAANEGITKAKNTLGNVDYKAIESKKKDEFQPNLQALVDNDSDLIFGVGFQMQDDITTIAKKYPNKKFAIIDSEVKLNNVVSLEFKEQEGSFLMGVIAGKTTKSNKIGFIGGNDIDLINKFAAGYIAGAKAVNPNVQIDVKYTNSFSDPSLGEEAARTLYNGGCDVIYHAAGGSGLGLFKATKEMSKPDKKLWAIGVDMDQAITVPEYADVILSSMIKKVDTATNTTVTDFANGKFAGGKAVVLGLKEDGVGIAPSSNKNVPSDLLDLVVKYKKAIVDGKIVVPTTKADAANFKAPAI